MAVAWSSRTFDDRSREGVMTGHVNRVMTSAGSRLPGCNATQRRLNQGQVKERST